MASKSIIVAVCLGILDEEYMHDFKSCERDLRTWMDPIHYVTFNMVFGSIYDILVQPEGSFDDAIMDVLSTEDALRWCIDHVFEAIKPDKGEEARAMFLVLEHALRLVHKKGSFYMQKMHSRINKKVEDDLNSKMDSVMQQVQGTN